jgi:hypothetical protein
MVHQFDDQLAEFHHLAVDFNDLGLDVGVYGRLWPFTGRG